MFGVFMSFSQKEAVFNAVKSVLAKSGKEIDGKISLTKEERAAVTEIVATSIEAGEVVFSEEAFSKHNTPEKIRSYTAGMVGNWLTKDTRLNGGIAYSPKNPGSRAGQGDAMIRNLKALRGQLTDQSHIEAVDAQINKRATELASSKKKVVEIDYSKIPAELLAQLNLG
jgi:hypothetical protein